jgi:hypothetical protein
MVLAARTAVERSSGVMRISAGAAAAVQVGAELAGLGLALHGRDHLVADDEAADVGAAGLLDVLLHQDVGLQPHEGLDHALGRLLRLGQHHADALGALQQLDDQRRAADHLDQVSMSSGASGRSRSPAGRCPCARAAAASAACRASG